MENPLQDDASFMKSHRLRCVAVGLLAIVGCKIAAAQCVEIGSQAKWSPSRPLLRERAIIARDPSATLADTLAYVVGINIPYFTADPMPTDPLSAVVVGERSIGSPSSRSFTFMAPRIVGARSGNVVMVWGEPDSARGSLSRGMAQVASAASLWAATYSRGTGWRDVEKIQTGSGIVWNSFAGRHSLFATDSGVAFVVEVGGRTLLVQRAAERWSSQALPGHDLVVEATGNADLKGRIVVALAARMQASTHDIVIVRSDDVGKTWSKASHFAVDAGIQPREVRVVFAGPKAYVLWARGSGMQATGIDGLVSNDRGETWTRMPTLTTSVSFLSSDVAGDPCGRVFIALTHLTVGSANGHIDFDMWNDSWKNLGPSTDLALATDPAILIGPNGMLKLFYLSYPDTLGRTSPQTVVTGLSPHD